MIYNYTAGFNVTIVIPQDALDAGVTVDKEYVVNEGINLFTDYLKTLFKDFELVDKYYDEYTDEVVLIFESSEHVAPNQISNRIFRDSDQYQFIVSDSYSYGPIKDFNYYEEPVRDEMEVDIDVIFSDRDEYSIAGVDESLNEHCDDIQTLDDFLAKAEVILVDDAETFDINEWERRDAEEMSEELDQEIEINPKSKFVKYKLEDADLDRVIDKIKSSPINIVDYWKTTQFLKKRGLEKSDLDDVIHNLSKENYVANSRSTDDKHNEAIIFVKDSKVKDLEPFNLYIKLDYDSIEKAPVIVISIHETFKEKIDNLKESTLDDMQAWAKKRQKGLPALSMLKTDAGDVEYNNAYFNHLTSTNDNSTVTESEKGLDKDMNKKYPVNKALLTALEDDLAHLDSLTSNTYNLTELFKEVDLSYPSIRLLKDQIIPSAEDAEDAAQQVAEILKTVIEYRKSESLGEGYQDTETVSREELDEDVIKQDGKWVNKGKEGTHGKFATKKEANAQRRAMFASGYKESVNESWKDFKFIVKCNDGPKELVRVVAENKSKAEGYAKDMYAANHTTYADDRYNEWFVKDVSYLKDESLKEDLAVNGEETLVDTANEPAVKPAVIIIKVESGISADGFEVTVKDTDGHIIEQHDFRYGFTASYSKPGADRYKPFVTDIIKSYLSKYNLNKDNIIVTKGRNAFTGEYVSDKDITDFKTDYLGSLLDESKNEPLKEAYQDVDSMSREELMSEIDDIYTDALRGNHIDITSIIEDPEVFNSDDSDDEEGYFKGVPTNKLRGILKILRKMLSGGSLTYDDVRFMVSKDESVNESKDLIDFLDTGILGAKIGDKILDTKTGKTGEVKKEGQVDNYNLIYVDFGSGLRKINPMDDAQTEGRYKFADRDDSLNESISKSDRDIIIDAVKGEFETGHGYMEDKDEFEEMIGRKLTQSKYEELKDFYSELQDLGPEGFYEEYRDKLEFDPDFVSEYGHEEGEWEEVASKQVEDSDGFMTDYVWYTDGFKHIFVFGDSEIYRPEDGYFDWEIDIIKGKEAESYREAQEWFDSYNGFADALDEKLKCEDLDLIDNPSLDEIWLEIEDAGGVESYKHDLDAEIKDNEGFLKYLKTLKDTTGTNFDNMDDVRDAIENTERYLDRCKLRLSLVSKDKFLK